MFKIPLIIISVVLIQYLLCMGILSYVLFVMHLKRTSPQKWDGGCSSSEDYQVAMFEAGLAWAREFEDRRQELHLENEGLRLHGEFFDFGSDKAVVIVPGRTEGLKYGYFFARPYSDMGYSILTIDPRAHGQSDGKFNTVGFDEHRDLIAWTKYIAQNFGVKTVYYHGICIGAACSLYALTSPDCPPEAAGLIAEGMFPSFYESFKNHMIELKKPIFPALQLVDLWMRLLTGHSMKRGPRDIIQRLEKPLLMLHSRKDIYSMPNRAEELYALCASRRKKLVWFDRGGHSQLRYTDPEAYDGAIKNFLQ